MAREETTVEKRRFTIGQMADVCNLSAEQLRNYDRIGLISPVIRGENNYRYYSEEQIEDVLLIKEMKNAGLSLKSIKSLLDDKNVLKIKASLENHLAIQREKLYASLKSYDLIVNYLLKINEAIPIVHGAAEAETTLEASRRSYSIIPIAQRPIVFTRYRSSCSVDDTFIFRYTELQNLIEREKIETARGFFLLFHEHYDRQFMAPEEAIGDLELFSNISGSMGNPAYCRYFGGFMAASATHVGPYRETRAVYDDLTNWATDLGYKTNGLSFQELIIDRRMTSDESKFVTKVYLPLDIVDI